MKLKSKNKKFEIVRSPLDFPEAHFGYTYDIKKHGKPFKWDLSKSELNKLRKKLKF